MDPVNKRTAFGLGHGPGGADDKDRRAVEIGVVDAHRRVQQTDQIVHDGDHRLALGTGIAMGDLDGDLFVLAKQHRWVVLAVVDQRVMQPAVARSRVERDVFEVVALDHVDDDIRLPSPIGFLDGLYFRGWLCHVTFLLVLFHHEEREVHEEIFLCDF